MYSIRMRSADNAPHEQGGRHVSGGERLVDAHCVEEAVLALFRRAWAKESGFIHLTVERIPPDSIQEAPVLPWTTAPATTFQTSRTQAISLLERAGISANVSKMAIRLLDEGPAPGRQVMRGAVIMDAATGERLETDRSRGIRTTRVDVPEVIDKELAARLAADGLTHPRTREALILASKTAAAGALAELCWSDDPDYTAGYVASPIFGYIRLAHLKPPGSQRGGRVYFVDPKQTDLMRFIAFLEETPVMLSSLP